MFEISPKEYETGLNWHDAKLYCPFFVIDDKIDWRLPSIEELLEISNNPNDLEDNYYWSSETYNVGLPCIFLPSRKAQYYNNGTLKYYVRPIRTIQ